MHAPNPNLQYINVPGLAEAREKEHCLRDEAFLPIPEQIAGMEVRSLTPSILLILDALKNGFVVPCTFERASEKVAHAMQFLWVISPHYQIPRGKLHRLKQDVKLWFFRRKVKRINGFDVYRGINEYIERAFHDCPGASSAASPGGAIIRTIRPASYMAQLVDDLYGAGYPWSEEQILNTPLKRLWQYIRLSARRLDPELTLQNPSDRLADEFIAEMNRKAASV